ncbi:hypothetical protein DFH07DRAFT_938297 [Mycena maculata]|uniref:Uncharacterized protein n=1 Tax=Mycena maculata TaxID=230809 RepID=A0AAD7NNR5_9AGAR|nr:hypothetical protein DFH07DRAFT_938297 [Mycena maculata]
MPPEYQRFLADNPDVSTTSAPPPTPTPTAPTPTAPAPAHTAAPVTHAYQSSRIHPPPLIAPSSYQPFLGMHTLAPSASTLAQSHFNRERLLPSTSNLQTSQANDDRLRHAALGSINPNRVARRTRGPAQSAPTLPHKIRKTTRPSIDQCLVVDVETPTVKVLVLVYPPFDPEGDYQDHLVYRTLHTDFVAVLEQKHLVYRYQLTLASTVNDMLIGVVGDMAASAAHYEFALARRTLSSNLITNLQVLGLVDRGRVHKKLGVHARIEPHTLQTTVGDLAGDRNWFSHEVTWGVGHGIARQNSYLFLFYSKVSGTGRNLVHISTSELHATLVTYKAMTSRSKKIRSKFPFRSMSIKI